MLARNGSVAATTHFEVEIREDDDIRFTMTYAKEFIATKLGQALTGLSTAVRAMLPEFLVHVSRFLPLSRGRYVKKKEKKR